jgi:Na+:H+ antiporter, NhaA family
MPEFPPPIRMFGEPPLPDEPYTERAALDEPPMEDRDRFGAEAAAATLCSRIKALQPTAATLAGDGRPLLSPPFSLARDHVAGPVTAPSTLVVFGAFATPASRKLARLIEDVRERHPATLRVAWRHHPEPDAHPHTVMLALAAEAAAARGQFWALTYELMRLRHDDPPDLHAALLRAGLDPERTLEAMRAGTGADRIADDVASAMASGVRFPPALFIDGERYAGPLEASALPIHATPGARGRDV